MRIPDSFGFHRLAVARPWRHRYPNNGKRGTPCVSKLEGSFDGNGEGDTRPQVDSLIEAIPVLTLHLPQSLYDVPDFRYSAVALGTRNLTGPQFEVNETGPIRPHQ